MRHGPITQSIQMRRSEVLVSTLPEPSAEIFTNTKIRVFCQRSPSQPVSFVAEWRRQSPEVQEIIHNHDNSSYECSPLDLDCYIEVKLKYDDCGIHTTTRRFGPVRLQPQLQSPHPVDSFQAKTLIDNANLQMNLVITKDQFILSSHGLDFSIKLQSLPYPELRLENYIVSFRLRVLAEGFTKFVTTVLGRPLKYRQEVLDLVLESPSKRNYLLFRLMKYLKRKHSGGMNLSASTGYTRRGGIIQGGQGIQFGTATQTPKDENRTRKLSNNSSLSIPKNRGVQAQKKSQITESMIRNERSNTSPIITPLSNDLLNQTKQLFSEFDPSPQAALNLRDSFVQLQQKQQMKTSFISDQTVRLLRIELDEAKNTMRLMGEEIRKLKKENAALRVSWGEMSSNQSNQSNQSTTSSGVEVSKLQQRVDGLLQENKRLESQRTQIIADKLAAEVRCNRQKQEKEHLKRELEMLKGTPEALRSEIMFRSDNVFLEHKLDSSKHDRVATHPQFRTTNPPPTTPNSSSRNNLSQQQLYVISQNKSFKDRKPAIYVQTQQPQQNNSQSRLSPLRGKPGQPYGQQPASPLSASKTKIPSTTTPRAVPRQ